MASKLLRGRHVTAVHHKAVHVIRLTMPYQDILLVTNPLESYYHVRYMSEITDGPLGGDEMNTRLKTKKNISE